MTPEAQRIAIAKTCGWKKIRCHPKTKVWFAIPPPKRQPQWDVLLPDYLSDLNAMHEAEKVMTEDQQHDYESHLLRMKYPGWAIKVTHATAAQRAEAFLRTIGKWEE